MNTTVKPSELIMSLARMGYGLELSAPIIANTYLEFKATGKPLPRVWEKSTIKDVETCYNKLMRGE